MKLLVDTTYLLPAIGISIKGLPNDVLIKLLKKGHKISISNISIIYNETITTIPTHESTLLLTAFKLRSLLSGFIDCLTPNI